MVDLALGSMLETFPICASKSTRVVSANSHGNRRFRITTGRLQGNISPWYEGPKDVVSVADNLGNDIAPEHYVAHHACTFPKEQNGCDTRPSNRTISAPSAGSCACLVIEPYMRVSTLAQYA